MFNLYSAIVGNPLLPAFLLMCAAAFLIMHTTSLPAPHRLRKAWLRENYVYLVLSIAACLAIMALIFYLFEIGVSVRSMVDLLKAEALQDAALTNQRASNLRNLSHAVAVLVGVLAAAATLVFSLIKVWVNERTATATEQRLITEQINKAVEGLGAEKRIKFRGRDEQWSRIDAHGVERREGFFQKWGEGPDIKGKLPSDFDGMSENQIDKYVRFGDWADVEESVPNLEVRVGAIYALERISQDSDRDHIRIMEILCAYIRENAPAEKAVPFPQPWAEAFEADWDDKSIDRPDSEDIEAWAENLPKPCVDIQTALDVIGRRAPKKIALERAPNPRSDNGYRLDLRGTNLQRYNLNNLNFDRAILTGAQLQGAILWQTQLIQADLGRAQLQRVILLEANLQRADLSAAKLQGALLTESQLQGANLSLAHLQIARVQEAQLQGAFLICSQLQNATLRLSQLQGAFLMDAELQGTYLGRTQLQGADLGGANLQGADLRQAQFDEKTSTRPASLLGAGLYEVDVSMLDLTPEFISEAFGDCSTILSGDLRKAFGDREQPTHWLDRKVDDYEFDNEWRKWQRDVLKMNPDGSLNIE